MKKHSGTNIIRQLPVSAAPTYKQIEKASEDNKRRYKGLYVRYRGVTV